MSAAIRAPIDGCSYWLSTTAGKYDPIGRELVRGHYSRRKPDSPQFMPPGETIVLISHDELSLWGWWRPHPKSGIKAMNGQDGWTCSVFSRHGGGQTASQLVLDAERALAMLTSSGQTAGACGPSGMLTYVWRAKVKSQNPGYCYKVAGWTKVGVSADGKKDLLQKPFALASVQACAWPRRTSRDLIEIARAA